MKGYAYIRTNNNNASLLKQMEILKAFVVQKNWHLDSVYADVGSGNDMLLKMIEDAQQGKINYIIASDPARISRNPDYLFNIVRQLREQNKVHIVTVDNQINTFLNKNIL